MTLRRYSDLRSTLHPSQLGPWIINWFWISSVLCLYDAAFVYFRPHTLPGGSLAKYFSICKSIAAINFINAISMS